MTVMTMMSVREELVVKSSGEPFGCLFSVMGDSMRTLSESAASTK